MSKVRKSVSKERGGGAAKKSRRASSGSRLEPAHGNDIPLVDRYRGCLLGLAVGDALGTTVEFAPRGLFPPVTDMIGGGPFEPQPGQWTDDTSMALCLAESLLYRNEFDPVDQMNRYVNWWQHGYLSSTGECFDIGNTTQQALSRYLLTGEPFSGTDDPRSAGNGSLMRLAPISLYYYSSATACSHYAAASSRTTHAAGEAVDCCKLLAHVVRNALRGVPKDELLASEAPDLAESAVRDLSSTNYASVGEGAINGSGYCVESLRAALWCFVRTSSFAEAVLMAVNLGDDADTTGAITGQIAGAYYGVEAIPRSWRDRLAMGEYIETTARRLFERASMAGTGA